MTDRIADLEEELRETRGALTQARERAAHTVRALKATIEVMDAALTHARGALLMAREAEYEVKRLIGEEEP